MSTNVLEFDLLKKGIVEFTVPIMGKDYTFAQTYLNSEADGTLDDKRIALVKEARELLWDTDQAGNQTLREQTASMRERRDEIEQELRLILGKNFCQRITAWPLGQAGQKWELTPEVVREKFGDNTAFLSMVLAWADEKRYEFPKRAI